MLNTPRKRRFADAGLPSASSVELPLETTEQIEFSQVVDDALERRAQRRKAEREAEAAGIANDRDRFRLLREKIYLGVGLIVLMLVAIAAVLLWTSGQQKEALWVVGSSGGLGGASLIGRQIQRRGGDTGD